MLAALHPYGPERQDCYSTDDVALGRGLFIATPEDAYDRQPLRSADGRFVVVADLRLDNREDLLAAFRLSGPDYRQQSDADLLMLAIERWQDQAFDRLVGDFAIALWDAQDGELILARDPLGERSLFYHERAGLFAFASLPKGLHALPEIPRALMVE
jgi:asparagine synthase (glutamine-hydrolysing)